MSEKSAIRARMRAQLAELTPEALESAGRAALRHLDELPEWRNTAPDSNPAQRPPRALGAFLSGSGEISTAPLLRRALGRGWRVAVPAWHASDRLYRLAWMDEETGFVNGIHGIPEPESPKWVPRDALALIIVPGLAFNTLGGRLGRGGGFYDRILSVYSGKRVGFALDVQRWDQPLPMLAHDQKMDALVTDQGFWRFDSKGGEL